jgi:hypothetical protein
VRAANPAKIARPFRFDQLGIGLPTPNVIGPSTPIHWGILTAQES